MGPAQKLLYGLGQKVVDMHPYIMGHLPIAIYDQKNVRKVVILPGQTHFA